MTAEPARHIRTSCRRKVRHETREGAMHAMWRTCSASPRRWPWAYECAACGGYHWDGPKRATLQAFDRLMEHLAAARTLVEVNAVARGHAEFVQSLEAGTEAERVMALHVKNMARYRRICIKGDAAK